MVISLSSCSSVSVAADTKSSSKHNLMLSWFWVCSVIRLGQWFIQHNGFLRAQTSICVHDHVYSMNTKQPLNCAPAAVYHYWGGQLYAEVGWEVFGDIRETPHWVSSDIRRP